MPDFRYAQFCPLARAAEIVGERWTLLIVRELLLGPQRFSDLRRRLPGLSASVLSNRLDRLMETGLIERAALPAPMASDVFRLTPDGQALLPAITELGRWGLRYLGLPDPGDHYEPEWALLGLEILASRKPTPELTFEIELTDAEGSGPIAIHGGPEGTRIDRQPAVGEAPVVAARLRTSGLSLVALAGGHVDPRAAVADGSLEIDGSIRALDHFSELFDAPAS